MTLIQSLREIHRRLNELATNGLAMLKGDDRLALKAEVVALGQRLDELETTTEPRFARDGAALVNPAYKWHRITPETPRKAKVLLINKEAGVLTTGAIGSWPTWFTHYCELPVFDKEEEHGNGS